MSNEDETGVSVDSGTVSISFAGIQVDNEDDLKELLIAVAPLAAKGAFEARRSRSRDWSVTGTVTTTSGGTTTTASGTYSGGKEYSVSGSASTTVGGTTVTGTVTTGTQGTSGTVTVSGSF